MKHERTGFRTGTFKTFGAGTETGILIIKRKLKTQNPSTLIWTKKKINNRNLTGAFKSKRFQAPCPIIVTLFCSLAGAGGGWAPGNYTEDKKTTGSALLGTGGVSSDSGGVGGHACYKSRSNTKGFGGFGGGGGGCVAGGGGGGFTGEPIVLMLK